MASKVYGVDFGTSAIKVYKKGDGIIYDAKNIIAIMNDDKVMAIGDDAFEMLGKAPANINVTYPVKNGVIADIKNMLALLGRVFEIIGEKYGKVNGGEFIVAVPTRITEVEKRAFYDLVASSTAKSKKIKVVEKPIADALGADINVTDASGVMVVDIGADTTEISVLSLGGIVISDLIDTGGNKLDELIITNVKRVYNLMIGNKTAEVIKKQLSSFVEPTDEHGIKVFGRDIVTGLPIEKEISAKFVYEVLREQLYGLIDNVKSVLERTPPEIASDIIDSGIYITGGSAKIKDLSSVFETETGLKINICEDSSNTVINGLGKIVENEAGYGSLAFGPRPTNYNI